MKKLGKYGMLIEIQVAFVMLIVAFSEFAPVSASLSFAGFCVALAISFGNNIFYIYKERKKEECLTAYALVSLAGVILVLNNFWSSAILIMCINLIMMSQIKFLREMIDGKLALYTDRLNGEFTAFSRGNEVLVKGDKLNKGNIFVAREGELIATDGIVFYGEATVDEDVFNMPKRDVKKGAMVLAGSKNISGNIQIEALTSQQDSFMGQFIDRMKESVSYRDKETDKRKKINYAIQIAGVLIALVLCYVPAITDEYGIALNYKLAVAILLLVSFDNVIQLFKLAYRQFFLREAINGVSIKNIDSLKKIKNVENIVVEKKEEFTYGKYELVSIDEEIGFSKEELLVLSAHAQHKSKHPIAKAVKDGYIQFIKYKNLDENKAIREEFVEKFEELREMGVTARVKNKLVFVGNEKLMRLINVRNLKNDDNYKWVYIAINGKYAGRMGFNYIENEKIENINNAFTKAGISRYANVEKHDLNIVRELKSELVKNEILGYISSEDSKIFSNISDDGIFIGIDAMESRKIDKNTDISISRGNIIQSLSIIRRYKGFLRNSQFALWAVAVFKLAIYPVAIISDISISTIFAIDSILSSTFLYMILNKNKKDVDKEI